MDGTGPIGTLIMMMMRAAIRRILLPFLARRRVGFCSTSVPQACSTGPDSQPQGSEQIMNKNEFFFFNNKLLLIRASFGGADLDRI